MTAIARPLHVRFAEEFIIWAPPKRDFATQLCKCVRRTMGPEGSLQRKIKRKVQQWLTDWELSDLASVLQHLSLFQSSVRHWNRSLLVLHCTFVDHNPRQTHPAHSDLTLPTTDWTTCTREDRHTGWHNLVLAPFSMSFDLLCSEASATDWMFPE